jgi:hypothetical protein
MNRGTVILVALAILLAHTFAIHQIPKNGDIAAPYEIAHVSYRLGRNLVYEGAALWNPGGAPAESYPSVMWVLVSALAARVYLSPGFVAQGLGLCAALATVIVLAQFSPKRASGLIAPLLARLLAIPHGLEGQFIVLMRWQMANLAVNFAVRIFSHVLQAHQRPINRQLEIERAKERIRNVAFPHRGNAP